VSDADLVRRAIDEGRLLHPDGGVAGTVDLARAMASLAGAPIRTTHARTQFLADLIGTHDHYIFVLVDGLGMNLVESLPRDAFFPSRVAAELRAVFPSSTAPALTSIATACWPAEHAVVGWWTYLPDAALTATVLPYVERFTEQPLDPMAVQPRHVFPVPACAPGFAHEFMMFTPANIAGSVYSRYSTGDAPSSGYDRLGAGVDAIIARIAAARRPTFSYLYVPHVDYQEHLHGPHSTAADLALHRVQREIERLTAAVAGRARVVVTADHGQLTVGAKTALARDDRLMKMLIVPPTGDGRTVFFHVAPGLRDAFADAFRDRFDGRFALLTTDEVDELHLFGAPPLSDETRRRLGDYVGVAFADDVLQYEAQPGEPLLGHHGGLTPDEMRIPLILA
jgi:predicted AlkP superfamily pyrophosphatase or phosphodiesterase